MGKLEHVAAKRMRKGKLQNALLSALAIGGIVTLAIAAPNAVQLLKRVDPEWLTKRDPKQRLQEVASRLKKKGYVVWETERGKTRLRITPKGKSFLDLSTGIEDRGKPRKWDGKWRIVIFDIPEKQRALRQKVRSAVTSFGFQLLQGSVWVYPYDCEDLVTLLKAELRIGKNLLYIIADAIEYDAPLKQAFKLR